MIHKRNAFSLLTGVLAFAVVSEGSLLGQPPGFPGMEADRKLVAAFDQDGNGRLDAQERRVARKFLETQPQRGRGPRGLRFGRDEAPPQPGEGLSPSDVRKFPDAPLYDAGTLRSFFLEFEEEDWEEELEAFNNTDVEVPATLRVDGKTFRDVGVHFRGASSFGFVSKGRKRSLNLSLDFVHEDQSLDGYETLNLLNSHGDPTFLRTVLYSRIARAYLPAAKANFARVAINGENWGIYQNLQQFNKDFLEDTYGTRDGARWKVSGSPRGQGSLEYLGEDAEPYKEIYTIKSKDEPESWDALIQLCKVLSQTPADRLEEALAPILDVDGALKFLALEITLINNDGYWIRTSDYNLYRDPQGRFHIIPHDINEAFARPGGPGFGGRGGPPGRRGGFDERRDPVEGVSLDPLYAANDPGKPLISKLLSVPALKDRYLGYVRDIAENWLDWNKLGPIARQYHELIEEDVKKDTRKLDSFEHFKQGLLEDVGGGERRGPFGGGHIGLKSFADQRREYLLSLPDVKAASFSPSAADTQTTLEAAASELKSESPVVINEFMASNDQAHADPQGDYDDWIELRNVSDRDVDLAGRYLSDDPFKPRKWPFPEGTIVKANGYLLIWADEDGSDAPGLHANFKLAADGEEIFFNDTDENQNAALDRIVFEQQETDVSFGRSASDKGSWKSMKPTPGSANQ